MSEHSPLLNAVSGPALSRAFISMDDAAVHAHEQVGKRRDAAYASCIFKRDDGRFVVSEPVKSVEGLFDNRLLYPKDAQGKPIFPARHTLCGLFYSHVALSMLDTQEVARLGWSAHDAADSLLMFSVDELRYLLEQSLPAYLSGAEHSLIRLAPIPGKTGALWTKLGTAQQPGPLATRLESGAAKPRELIDEVSLACDWYVKLSNGLDPQWRRNVSPSLFGAIFASAEAAAQDRYLRDPQSHDEDRTWFGFILKQRGKEEYIATDLVPWIKDVYSLFALKSLFPASGIRGGYRFPESFAIHSYFYARPRVPHAKGTSKNWLAHNFIVPEDLFVAVYNSNKHPQVETQGPLSTFISTMDGALLKYTPLRNSRLFDNDTPVIGFAEIESNLASGKITTTGFVRIAATYGELSVLRTSLCWDRRGVVPNNWSPSQYLQRLALGPVCLTADDAAIQAREKLPFGSAVAHGGLILQRADGAFVATDPISLLQEDFEIDFIFPDASINQGAFLAGCRIVGRYRSRVARELPILLSEVDKQVYLNMLSTEVIYSNFMKSSERLQEYLFCPDGAIIRYRSGLRDQIWADLITALDATLAHDLDAAWIRNRIHKGEMSPFDWVKHLVDKGYLGVVVGSKLWGFPREVTSFSPYTKAVFGSAATCEPICSPLFIQEAGAARYIHEHPERIDALHFGFILSNTQSNTYLASLPVEVQNNNLALTRVFPQGSLPSRHSLQGLYLRAPLATPSLADQDYRHFFSPVDVSLILASANTAQGYKPVYFSCADGALLRFAMAPFDPDAPLDQFGQIQLRANPFASSTRAAHYWQQIIKGTFELDRYIRNMAKAGTLEVLIPSAFWSRMGTVGPDWSARMPDLSPEVHWANKPELALGPVFHHADDAARYAQRRAGSGYEQSAAYESAILSKADTYSYVALEPLVETDTDVALDRIFRTGKESVDTPRNKPPRFPDGYQLMAGHQLYASGNTTLTKDPEQVYANYASPALVFAHTFALKDKGFAITAHYYSTPHGALVKYVPGYSAEERNLLTTKTADVVDGQWVTRLSPGSFISQLANFAELRVLEAAHYWNLEGRLGTDWRTSRQQAPVGLQKLSRDEL